MKANGDIIIIDDDPDDWEILLGVFGEVIEEHNFSNRVIIFEDSTMVMDYLKGSESEIFMVLSDVNMPRLNGFQLRESIYEIPALYKRCMPYIFLSTCSDKDCISKAFEMPLQGFFEKPRSLPDYRKLISEIVMYWKHCLASS
jgi:CheY-like chemotaxis protein